jgi:hypothetical protein
MRRLLAPLSVITPLVAGIVPAQALQVPHLAIQRVCRGIARHAASPGEAGGPDLAFRSCITSELNVRKQLRRVWNSFSVSERSECFGEVTAGGLPSYTALLTCLQLSRDAAKARRGGAR